MKITALYLRVSTPQEPRRPPQPGEANLPIRPWKARQEESLPRQRELLVTWTRSHIDSLSEIEVFEDDRSGQDGTRKRFQDLISKIEQGKVQRLVTYDDSRLARNQKLMQSLMWLCYQHGVEVWIHAWRRQVNWQDDSDRMMLGLSSFVNEFFLQNLRRSVKDGAERLVKQGGWINRAPYGYVRGPDKHLTPVDEEISIVKRIWAEIRQHGMRVITLRLEADRLVGQGAGWKDSRPWTIRAVQQILVNPVYTGSVVSNRSDPATLRPLPREQWLIVEKAHPAVVDWTEFDAVQMLIRSRGHGRNPFQVRMRNPYAELIICGHHGFSLRGCRRDGKPEYLLHCRVLCCPNSGVPVSTIEARVLEETRGQGRVGDEVQRTLRDSRSKAEAELVAKRRGIQSQRAQIGRTRQTQQELVMRLSRGQLTQDAFEREMRSVGEMLSRWEREAQEAEQESEPIVSALSDLAEKERLAGVSSRLRELAVEEKRQVLPKVIERITLLERTRMCIDYVEEEA